MDSHSVLDPTVGSSLSLENSLAAAQVEASAQISAMRFSLDPLADRRVSRDCFRLVELTTEVQNETEVVKPVLNEQEVLRLSSALGLLPSVNPKDFDYDLAPDAFDEEFARYLRQTLGNDRSERAEEGIAALGLFGKQSEVKRSLQGFKLWSSEMETRLDASDQGIYCVKRVEEDPEPEPPDAASTQTVVLFVWIHDHLFDAERLRDTATYVLRFLSCMSSNVQLCVSEQDIAEVKNAVDLASTGGGWTPSFSFGFRVEKQQDQQDGVVCEHKATIELRERDQVRGLRLVKGSYPALSFVCHSPRRKVIRKDTVRFVTSEDFSKWVVEQAKNFSIDWDFYRLSPLQIREDLLMASGHWPGLQLDVLDSSFAAGLCEIERKSEDRVLMQLEDCRSRLLAIEHLLFDFNCLLDSEEHRSKSFEELMKILKPLKENNEAWLTVDEQLKAMLHLPIRLKNNFESIFATFHIEYQSKGEDNRFTKLLEKIPFEKKKVQIPSSQKNMFSKAWAFITRKQDTPVDVDQAVVAAFRTRMSEWLHLIRQEWWTSVNDILQDLQPRMTSRLILNKKVAFEQQTKDDRSQTIARAFDTLLKLWKHDDDDDVLRLKLSPQRSSYGSHSISCDCWKETWTQTTDELHFLILICDNGGWSREDALGFFALKSDEEVIQCFAIRVYGMLAVLSSPSGTEIVRLEFYRGRGYGMQDRQTRHSIKHFGRKCMACDFNFEERLMVFVTEGNALHIFRFSPKFETMELIKRVDLGVQSSLSAVVDLVIAENSVYMIDESSTIQSINFRSLQTSRASKNLQNDTSSSWGRLMLLSDGLAVGRLSISSNTDSAFVASLNVLASEDFRDIPASFPDTTILCDSVSAVCVGNKLFVIDSVAGRVEVFDLTLTVRSDSFRIRHSDQSTRSGLPRDAVDSRRDEHWLRSLFHMFEKFPVGGLIESVGENSKQLRLRIGSLEQLPESTAIVFRDYFDMIMNDLRKLNKPLGMIDFTRSLRFVYDGMDDATDWWKPIKPSATRSFIHSLVTFVPVQICRAEGNVLSVLTNGVDGASTKRDTSSGVHAADIARSIRFGLLSPLLNAWKGPVVVITSMGKQSTGKSYMLNHLTGTSFAIAGARCTDGAWMSLRILPMGVMLVVLDFEGLGSFERSEQEDVLLSVLNASISMFTIFRMEMRFDKEMDDLFARFQKGVTLMKSDSRLFRGMLYMSVKDVNPNDQKGVMGEFVGKLQQLLSMDKEHNFLMDMYSGRLEINCSPPLGTLDYYRSLHNARNWIEGELCPASKKSGFQSGKSFLDCIRLVLAKISILDWTSLDDSARQFVLSEAIESLPGLLRTGNILSREYVTSQASLTNMLQPISEVSGSFEEICKEYPAMSEKWVMLKTGLQQTFPQDEEIDLGFDVSAVQDDAMSNANASLKKMFKTFASLRSHCDENQLDRDSQVLFDTFLAFIVRRRCYRIAFWAKAKFEGRVPDEWKTLEQQQLNRFTALLARCQTKCKCCGLGCMKSALHSSALDAVHDCGTNHQCQQLCSYCSKADNPGKTPMCSKESGHDGECECRDGDHTCKEACCLESSPNCGKRCSQIVGHEGKHHCGTSVHTCGNKCSLPGCADRCVLNTEVPHTVHKCIDVSCTAMCVMDDCNERCSEADHFHGHTDISVAFSVENQIDGKQPQLFDAESTPPVIHMCNKEHSCPALCGENGICRVDVYLKQSSRVFKGARGKFNYTYQEMNGSQKKCSYILAPKQQTHDGPHSCIVGRGAEGTVHYCDARCPTCSYYCNKEYDHSGMHATAHGNMRNTYFTADTMDVNVGDRKYRAGESGVAEMCNLYCSKMGRAHVHYLDCEQDSKESCVYSGSSNDQRRHCNRTLEPEPDNEMDELLHEEFWNTMGWEDPCGSAIERELFNKCDYKCDAPSHSDSPSHCILPAWHAPVQKPHTASADSDGFSYIGGHKFECSHVATNAKNHHVFVLDASGSMYGDPWIHLLTAVNTYIQNCVNSGSSLDLVSIVTFDSAARVVYEQQNVTLMVNARIPYMGKGTNYSAGLRLANEVLSRTNFETYKPVIVFFSDGYPGDQDYGARVSKNLKAKYEMYGLQAFVVGFGGKYLEMLKYVAEIMGGSYHDVLTGTEMKGAFYSISASVSSRAGLALAKTAAHDTECPICFKDLASGNTQQLPRCEHVLHDSCSEKLLKCALAAGTSALCPICRAQVS